MAKKINKLMLFGALAGAAVGTYCYFKNKKENTSDSTSDFDDFDDLDDFDDFDDDLDVNTSNSSDRSYVSLNLDEAKEKIGEKVVETIDKTKEKIEQFNVSEKLDKAKEKVENFTASNISVSSTYSHTSADDNTSKITENSASHTEATADDFIKTENFYDDLK